MVVVAVLAVLAVLVTDPSFGHRSHNTSRIQCVNNLANIGLGIRVTAADNQGSFYRIAELSGDPKVGHKSESFLEQPTELWRYFAALSNEFATPKWFACPSDTRRSLRDTWECVATNDHNGAISYSLGLESSEDHPKTILSTDRNLALKLSPVGNAVLTLKPDTAVGFYTNMHKLRGNVLLGDGSVQQVTSGRLLGVVRDSIQSRTNSSVLRIVVP
jgi:hypothetical protein